MLTRQKIILDLVRLSGGEISRLRLFKLAFLLRMEGRAKSLQSFYDFLPYKHGPFSFALSHELDKLAAEGLIASIGERAVRLGPAGKAIAESLRGPTFDDVRRTVESTSRLGTASLVDTTYSRFPWFTVNAKNPSRRRHTRNSAESAVYTVGYEKMQIDGLLDHLMRCGIEVLIDVRYNPVARRYGFHGTTLKRLCNELSIAYRHVPKVGIPGSWRSNLRNDADYLALFERYRAEVLPSSQDEIRAIVDWVSKSPTALMCSERDPEHCHRTQLATAVSNTCGLPVVDLTEEFHQRRETTAA
jgi:uncharacterized protein (DUF488 family)